MNYLIKSKKGILKGEVTVPSSKSISNRLLIIQALCNEKFSIQNISPSDDTKVLIQALSGKSDIIDIGHAGTSMRFLTAYFASQPGRIVLTGSERMKNRPIGNLVEALQKLGATINYLEKKGYPPLEIIGKQIEGGKTAIDGSVSSQFISALLLSAPSFKNGLSVELENNVISSSYINLTLQLMEYFGVKQAISGNIIKIEPQKYKPLPISVEGDWSSASYWYEMAAFANETEIFIHSLQQNSFQGDSRVAEIFKQLGINTEYFENGIKLTKTGNVITYLEHDFIETPDLVQTLAVTCVMLNVPFRFTGTQSLRIKETDRIKALQNELVKFGVNLDYASNGTLAWDGRTEKVNVNKFFIETYDDHRMALAFAPVVLLNYDVEIQNSKVVTKSYPTFWDDLKKFEFNIEEVI
jgi:3-phosphoshikimate 1-carboxyvinyltransferase